jgi:D-serine deaminase-like pyridoxal phosphate-dependent protein
VSRQVASELRSATRIDAAAVDALGDELLDWRYKGAPFEEMTLAQLRQANLHLLDGAFPMPSLTLRASALRNNVIELQRYCDEHDALLAPHGKTTMAPQLMAEQIRAGSWAMTCATPSQLRVYRHFGIGRVVYANELVEPNVIRWLADELRRDETFELYCLVDSPRGVALLDGVLAERPQPRPLPVLVEVGYEGGRTGCRTHADVQRVVAAVADTRTLRLAGVEGFEGLLAGADLDATLERVDGFLAKLVGDVELLHAIEALPESAIVTAGGSAFFDRVLEAVEPLRAHIDVRVVLRSGCYVTQDGGFYHDTSPLAGRAPGEPVLQNAFELWGAVVSRPERELAIVGFGKRDAPIDLGLPVPVATYRDGRGREEIDGHAQIAAMSDQHAHVRVDADLDLVPGDRLACTISHPCTAFDKWKLVPLVDDDYAVVDGVLTFF